MSHSAVNDVHPEIEALMIAGYRSMTPAQKIAIVTALIQTVQELALSDIRRRHPNADARELTLRLASRSVDPELLQRATGWDVRVEGY